MSIKIERIHQQEKLPYTQKLWTLLLFLSTGVRNFSIFAKEYEVEA
jgi:hypothetical protein